MMKLFSKNSNLCDHNSPTLQTDRQTTCDRNTALCTKVHRAVKTSINYYMQCAHMRAEQCALSYVDSARATHRPWIMRRPIASEQTALLRPVSWAYAEGCGGGNGRGRHALPWLRQKLGPERSVLSEGIAISLSNL